jgi:hypothetical protein
MRLILSRKGFDAVNGGIPSPILPDGRLCPLPIPDERSPLRYDDLSVAGLPLRKLLADLRPRKMKSEIFAHLDPDLDRNSLTRPVGWRPMFGQAGAAQSHLRNQGVGVGDLFLFFGWFREVEKKDGRYRYIPGSPDRHVIFGWLQVGACWPVDEPDNAPEWVTSHVHFRRSGRDKRNEIVYAAAERLSLPGYSLSLPGGGLLPKFRPSLALTAAGRSRSVWRLPGWFLPTLRTQQLLSYHGDFGRWQRDGADVVLRSAAIGQEFVLQGVGYPKMVDWVSALLTGMVNS